MKHTESSIQRELILWLKQTYPNVEYIFRKNEGMKSQQTATLDKKMGLMAGVPDLQLLLNKNNITYILELEIKIIKGMLNPNQRRWHAAFVETSNRKLATGYGFAQCKEIIENWIKDILAPQGHLTE
jgi:hypothetical protein